MSIIRLTDNIWIGGSGSWEKAATDIPEPIDSVLNVAQDLYVEVGWPDVEYAHVGLIDGPGNPPSAYCAAILVMHTLLVGRGAGKRLLVFCHDGSRSLAVVAMYHILKRGKTSTHPTFLNYWTPWDRMLETLQYEASGELSKIHPSHREAFDKLPLSLLENMI